MSAKLHALRFALTMVAAAHFGCSANPGPAASPSDAHNPTFDAAVDNDHPAPIPDVPATSDTPTPPPDVVTTPDVPPTQDVAPDASVDTAAPDHTMSETMDEVGGQLNRFSWQIAGTSVCDSITYEPGGEIHLGTELRIGLMASSSNGDCTTSPMSCACPAGGGPGATVLRGLTSTMTEFEAITGGTTYRLVGMTRCR